MGHNKRKGTKTSKFGSPGRIGHDSSSFYASKLYEDLPTEELVEYIENPENYSNLVFNFDNN